MSDKSISEVTLLDSPLVLQDDLSNELIEVLNAAGIEPLRIQDEEENSYFAYLKDTNGVYWGMKDKIGKYFS